MYQSEQVSIVLITITLCTAFVLVGKKLEKLNKDEVPTGLVFAVIQGVSMITNYTQSNMGQKAGRKFSPFITSVFIYMFVSNISGLVGLQPPTGNFSVTLGFALVTWVLIQATKIKENGFVGFIKGFFEPFPPFVIPNLFGTIAPLVSMSLRLFGNITSGAVIMTLLYQFTGWLSSFIPYIGGFNIISLIVTPWLHMYFDLFSGFLQSFLFISLTSIFIAVEFNNKEEN